PAGGGDQQTMRVAWPDVLVTARDAPPSASQSCSAADTHGRANLLSLPQATYRIGPWALVALLLLLAAFLAAAAVLIVLRTRSKAPATQVAASAAVSGGPGISPLEYALALLEDPTRVNGSGDQRRALELVPDGLGPRGRMLPPGRATLPWPRP